MTRENRLTRKGWNWSPVPADVILDKELSDFSTRLYSYLLWRAGNKGSAFPGADKIADDFGVSVAKVLRGYKSLVKNDWIRRYRRYGRSSLTCIFETKEECRSYQFSDDESIKNDMINISNMIRLNESKSNESKSNSNPKPPRTKTPQQEMIDMLCSVMGLEVNLNAARVARFASELVEMTITPAQIESAYGAGNTWWYRDHWRGKKGQKPTESAIRETLSQAAASQSAPAETESDSYHGKKVYV